MFSYWEQWPGTTGHAPTFDNLGKLAELYECAVSDLLVDLPDFRYLDTTAGKYSAPSVEWWAGMIGTGALYRLVMGVSIIV